MERDIFKPYFLTKKIPEWQCPICTIGKLAAKVTEFDIIETEESKRLRDHIDWDPDWICGTFIGKLKCQSCKEIVVMSGKMRVEYYTEFDGHDYDSFASETLFPKSITPSLHIFKLENDIPEDIKEAVIKAFDVFWIDPSSCANKIRIVVEIILDKKKIPRTFLNRKRKKEKLSLHKRLEYYKAKEKEVADLFMAIKWIGNHGSHAYTTIRHNDILDGMEILEHAFEKLYDSKTKRIKKLSSSIIKSKGPVKARRKKN